MQDMGNARSSGKVVKKEADFYVAAWMGRGLGREWMRVYVWLSSFTLHLKLSQHCLLMSYIYPNTKLKVQKIYKISLKKKKKEGGRHELTMTQKRCMPQGRASFGDGDSVMS